MTIHVDTESASQTLVIGILQGIAGGTLLYVTFYEVLERDKLEKIGMTGLLGCFLIVLGFGLMAGLEAAGKHKLIDLILCKLDLLWQGSPNISFIFQSGIGSSDLKSAIVGKAIHSKKLYWFIENCIFL